MAESLKKYWSGFWATFLQQEMSFQKKKNSHENIFSGRNILMRIYLQGKILTWMWFQEKAFSCTCIFRKKRHTCETAFLMRKKNILISIRKYLHENVFSIFREKHSHENVFLVFSFLWEYISVYSGKNILMKMYFQEKVWNGQKCPNMVIK